MHMASTPRRHNSYIVSNFFVMCRLFICRPLCIIFCHHEPLIILMRTFFLSLFGLVVNLLMHVSVASIAALLHIVCLQLDWSFCALKCRDWFGCHKNSTNQFLVRLDVFVLDEKSCR